MEVLEALLLALLLVGTAVFILSFQLPTQPNAQSRLDLGTSAGDVLRILEARSSPDTTSANLLAYDVMEAVQGNAHLTDQLHKYFPSAEFSLQVRNVAGGSYPVASSSTPTSQAVTADQLFRPGWNYLFTAPKFVRHDGSDPLTVAALPIVNGVRWNPQQELVRIDATYTAGSGTRNATLYEAVARPVGGAPTVSILQADASGNPALTYPAVDPTNLLTNPLCSLSCGFQVNVTESGGTTLRSGATLQVHIPAGWTLVSVDASSPWTTHAPIVGTSGPFTIRATLSSPLSSGSAVLGFHLTPPSSPTEPFQVLDAQLGHGALGHAQLVVPVTGATATEPRRLYASVPYPTGPGASATWAVSLANGLGSATLTKLKVTSLTGTDLFSSVTPVNAPAGTWAVATNGSSLTWTGSTTVSQDTAQDLVFRVGTPAATTTWSPGLDVRPWPQATFSSGYTVNLTRMDPAPGFFEAIVPPASYDATSGTDNPDGYTYHPAGTQIVNMTLVDPERAISLQRNLTYDTSVALTPGLLTALDAATTNATLGASPSPTVPGTYVRVDANLQSFITQLAQQGATNVQVKAKLYAPPSLGRHPLSTWNSTVAGQALASVVAGTAADVDGDGTLDAVVSATDHHLYALSVSGSTLQGSALWNVVLPGTATLVTTGVNAAGDTVVLAGDAGGNVTALDGPTSATDWSTRVAGSVWGLHGVNTDGTAGDDATWVLSQGTSLVRWALVSDTTGSTLVSGSYGGTGASSAGLGSDVALGTTGGDLKVLRTNGTVAWQANGTKAIQRLVATDVDGDGAPDLLVLRDQTVEARDGATGALIWTTSLGLTGGDAAAASVAHDLVGSATKDLVVATTNDRLILVNGASGIVQWNVPINRVPATLTTNSNTPSSCTTSTAGGPSVAVYALNECLTISSGSPYDAATQHTLVAPLPLAVVLGKDSVAGAPNILVAYAGQDSTSKRLAAVVDAFDPSTGAHPWLQPSSVNLTAGWPNVFLGEANASWAGAGTTGGYLWAVDPTAGVSTATTAVTLTQDQFRYRLTIPQGAFLGTNIFEVTVNWTDAGGTSESSNLFTTLDVLAPGATYPPDDSVYDALLTVWYPDWH